MKYYIHKSISERLYQAEDAIEIGRNKPELKKALAESGYNEKSFVIGAGYVATVKAIDMLRREQLGKQVNATARVEEAYRELRQNFEVDRKVVRLVLRRHPELIDQLRLREKTQSDRAEYILQARHFYEKVGENEQVKLLLQEEYGMAHGFMAKRHQAVVALEDAIVAQQYHKGQMTEITRKRQEAMKMLDAWMSKYIAIARVVFKDSIPNLHMLGIRVKQRKSTRK